MNIALTKKIEEANCITHSGTFHADEIFATIIISKILTKVTLIRMPEVEKEYQDKIIYDIGGKKFDHHQLGGNGKRENGVKYASCGLIWREYGKELLKKYEFEEIDLAWKYIDKNLIQFIDANDNGELPKLPAEYRNVHLAFMISVFNSKWDEDTENDVNFFKALNFAQIYFDEFIKDTIAKFKAKKIVEKAIEDAKDGIMILENAVPWKEFLLESKAIKAKDINYVVFPSKRGGYNVYAVPVEIGSFENRKTLPKKWRGLRDEELKKATGLKSARFCHNAGFICSLDEKEDAIKLAKMANLEY